MVPKLRISGIVLKSKVCLHHPDKKAFHTTGVHGSVVRIVCITTQGTSSGLCWLHKEHHKCKTFPKLSILVLHSPFNNLTWMTFSINFDSDFQTTFRIWMKICFVGSRLRTRQTWVIKGKHSWAPFTAISSITYGISFQTWHIDF